MSKKKQDIPTSKEEKIRKVRAIKKFSNGDYGIGNQQTPPEGFKEESIIKEGLEETYIDQQNL